MGVPAADRIVRGGRATARVRGHGGSDARLNLLNDVGDHPRELGRGKGSEDGVHGGVDPGHAEGSQLRLGVPEQLRCVDVPPPVHVREAREEVPIEQRPVSRRQRDHGVNVVGDPSQEQGLHSALHERRRPDPHIRPALVLVRPEHVQYVDDEGGPKKLERRGSRLALRGGARAWEFERRPGVGAAVERE